MTTEQIAKLDPEPRKGGRLSPFSPKNKTKTYPGSYRRTAYLLNRMQKDGEIHSDRDHNNQPLIWMLSPRTAAEYGVPAVTYPQNFYTRSHELDVASLFVAYERHVTHWDTQWGELERIKLDIPRYRVEYDARMVLNGRVYLIEVDRGSEDLAQLNDKISKYIDFSDSLHGHAFQVILTLQKYRRMHFGNRADKILGMLASKKRRHQFLVTRHSDILDSPLGAVFVSPLDPLVKLTLADLAS